MYKYVFFCITGTTSDPSSLLYYDIRPTPYVIALPGHDEWMHCPIVKRQYSSTTQHTQYRPRDDKLGVNALNDDTNTANWNNNQPSSLLDVYADEEVSSLRSKRMRRNSDSLYQRFHEDSYEDEYTVNITPDLAVLNKLTDGMHVEWVTSTGQPINDSRKTVLSNGTLHILKVSQLRRHF